MIENLPKGITVYCASANRIPRVYTDAAHELGAEIARSGLPLITGAGSMGLMGAINDACLAHGGVTIGVIPHFMKERGWEHHGLTHLVVTEDMHRRKETMAALSRAAIALPGGVGTFEELLEIITWRQLHLYEGEVVICNIDGYYDALLAMMERAGKEGFLSQDHRDHPTLFRVASTPAQALEMALGK